MGTYGDLHERAGRPDGGQEALAGDNAVPEELWDHWISEGDGAGSQEWDATLPCVACGSYMGESREIEFYCVPFRCWFHLGDQGEESSGGD